MLPVLTLPGSLLETLPVLRPCLASQQYPGHARTTPAAVATSTTTAITPTRAVLVILAASYAMAPSRPQDQDRITQVAVTVANVGSIQD
jgi:hypothetical protein